MPRDNQRLVQRTPGLWIIARIHNSHVPELRFLASHTKFPSFRCLHTAKRNRFERRVSYCSSARSPVVLWRTAICCEGDCIEHRKWTRSPSQRALRLRSNRRVNRRPSPASCPKRQTSSSVLSQPGEVMHCPVAPRPNFRVSSPLTSSDQESTWLILLPNLIRLPRILLSNSGMLLYSGRNWHKRPRTLGNWRMKPSSRNTRDC